MMISLQYDLIKELAIDKELFFPPIFTAVILWFWIELAISQHFYYELHFPLNLKVFLCLLLWNSKGELRQ